jgi:hypothetical protein
MRNLTRFLVGLAVLLVAFGAWKTGSTLALLAAVLIGLGWVALALWRPDGPLHHVALWSCIGLAGYSASCGVFLLPLLATVASLLAWDSAIQGHVLRAFSDSSRLPRPPRYLLSLVAVAGLSTLLGWIASWLPLRLPFPLLLALLIVVLAMAALTLWIGRRARQGERDGTVREKD